MFMLGRYLPQGNVEQILSRPLDFLAGATNPALKVGPALWQNRDYFKGRDTDALAGGPIAMLTNPLTGGPVEYATNKTFGVHLPASCQFL